MRLQTVKEGQIWQSKTGEEIAIIGVAEDRIQFECAGIIAFNSIKDFQTQVHTLIWDSYMLVEPEPFVLGRKFQTGEIWSDGNSNFIVLRNIRKSGNGAGMMNLGTGEIVQSKRLSNLKLRVGIKPAEAPHEIMFKSFIFPVAQYNDHNVVLKGDSGNFTAGFGNVTIPNALLSTEDLQELSDLIWANNGDMKSPAVQELIKEFETFILANRWTEI